MGERLGVRVGGTEGALDVYANFFALLSKSNRSERVESRRAPKVFHLRQSGRKCQGGLGDGSKGEEGIFTQKIYL